MNEILKISNLSKRFDHQVLKDISFAIHKGEVVGLTGLNGAGKTTLIKIILGLLKADKGYVKLSITPKQQIGVILQDVSLPDDMKVIEWLTLINKFSKNKTSNLDELLNKVELMKYKNSLCNKLSGGNKRKLQFAASIVNNPKFLILDEPTTGLDYKSKKEFWKLLKDMVRQTSLTVLIITHDLNEVENFTDRLLILHNTKIITDIDVKKLMKKISQKGIIYIKTNKDLTSVFEGNQLKKEHNQWILFTENISSAVSKLLSIGISYNELSIKATHLSDFFEKEVDLNHV